MRQRVDPGVVDQNVDSAKLGDDRFHDGVNVGLLVTSIGRPMQPGASAAAANVAVAVDVGKHDPAAVGGETIGDRLPDAAPRRSQH